LKFLYSVWFGSFFLLGRMHKQFVIICGPQKQDVNPIVSYLRQYIILHIISSFRMQIFVNPNTVPEYWDQKLNNSNHFWSKKNDVLSQI